MVQESWKFKILSGPYLGVVIDLPEGRFTLGTAEDKSDLVLAGYGLSELHLGFEVNQDQELYAVLLHKESNIKINSNIVEEDRFLVKDASILSTGTLNLALVFGDTPWPDFKNAPQQDQNDDSLESVEAEGETEATQKKKPSIMANPLVKSLLFSSMVLLIMLLPVSVLLIFSLVTEDASRPTTIITTDNTSNAEQDSKKIRRMVENAGLYNVNTTLVFSKTKVISVSGYVQNKKEFEDLKSILKGINSALVLKVNIEDTILQTVNNLLEQNSFKGLEAYPGEVAGSIILKGYIKDYSKFSRLENYLNFKVPGLKTWTLEYVDSRKLLVIFKRMLALAGLDDVKHIETDGKKLKVYADFNANQNKIFYQQAEYFRRRYGFSPVLEPYTQKLSDDSLNIASVEIGRNSRFSLKNGKVYMRGSKLPNGFIVKDINRKGITIVKGNKSMFYSFGVINHER